MKIYLASIFAVVLFSATANADIIRLSPGQTIELNDDTIICSEGSAEIIEGSYTKITDPSGTFSNPANVSNARYEDGQLKSVTLFGIVNFDCTGWDCVAYYASQYYDVTWKSERSFEITQRNTGQTALYRK